MADDMKRAMVAVTIAALGIFGQLLTQVRHKRGNQRHIGDCQKALDETSSFSLSTTSPVTIENLPDRDFGTGCQQAPDKLPTSSVLFDVGIVSNP
jgi:hypothetical protein